MTSRFMSGPILEDGASTDETFHLSIRVGDPYPWARCTVTFAREDTFPEVSTALT